MLQFGWTKNWVGTTVTLTVGPRFWGTNVFFLVGQTVRPLWDLDLDQLSLGLKQTADQLSPGLTVWVELTLGLNVGGLIIKVPKSSGSMQTCGAPALQQWKAAFTHVHNVRKLQRTLN